MSNIRNKDKLWFCKYIAIICWQIWKHMNKILFDDANFNMKIIMESVYRLKKELEE